MHDDDDDYHSGGGGGGGFMDGEDYADSRTADEMFAAAAVVPSSSSSRWQPAAATAAAEAVDPPAAAPAGSYSAAAVYAAPSTVTTTTTTTTTNSSSHNPVVFHARIINPNIIACGLRGIANGKREQHVQVVIVADDGIRFTTTDPTKSLQACAGISERFFEEWMMDGSTEELTFRVNLPVLLDCLTMLGTGEVANKAAPVVLEFRRDCCELSLVMYEFNAMTECVIKTISYSDGDDNGGGGGAGAGGEEDMCDFASVFRQADSVNKCIVPSDLFRDAFQELSELYGAQSVTVTMDPHQLRLSSKSEAGICYIDFGQAFFSMFDCRTSLEFTYRLSLLQRASKPLGEAEKTFMRVNSEGMLSFQHLLRQGATGPKTYVDVFVLADCGEEEGETRYADEE